MDGKCICHFQRPLTKGVVPFAPSDTNVTGRREKIPKQVVKATSPKPEETMKVRLLLTLAALSCAVPALRAEDTMKAIRADQIVWQNDTTFKGLQYANLLGDPAKAELIVSVVKLPPNFKIPLHTHPWSEVLTILSGSLGNASTDTEKGEMLPAGSVLVMPANHAHRIFTTDQETVFQFFYTGPFEMSFVNPADDPRKKAQ